MFTTLVSNFPFVHPFSLSTTFESVNGKVITSVSEATAKDVDAAVDAAQKAFDTVWGLNASGSQRSILLGKLAKLLEDNADELAALETLDNGVSLHGYVSVSVAF